MVISSTVGIGGVVDHRYSKNDETREAHLGKLAAVRRHSIGSGNFSSQSAPQRMSYMQQHNIEDEYSTHKGSCCHHHPQQSSQSPGVPRSLEKTQAIKKRPLEVAFPNKIPIHSSSNNSWRQNSQQQLSSGGISAAPKPAPSAKNSIASSSKKPSCMPMTALCLLNRNRREEEDCPGKSLYLLPKKVSWLKLGLGITELAGPAGSGKSQMAMSVCIQAVLGQQETVTAPPSSTTSPSFKAIYISLAGGQSSLSRIAYRLQQMADADPAQKQQGQLQITQPSNQQQRYKYQQQQDWQPQVPQRSTAGRHSVLSQILTHSVRNHEDLFCLLRVELPERLHQEEGQSVSVIVLDSIADLFRVGSGDSAVQDKSNMTQRSFLLFDTAALLKKLSDQFGIPILVINQVSSDFSSNTTIPTLGLSWSNCVNTQMMLTKSSQHRQILLTKSSQHPVNRRATFKIEAHGIEPLDCYY
jgi:RecA/RadA recombinase